MNMDNAMADTHDKSFKSLATKEFGTLSLRNLSKGKNKSVKEST
jgi:hypothetical protein